MRHLPTIDVDRLEIAAPCDARWADMQPVREADDRVRHCGDCDKNVYRLDDMTRAEIEALIREREGDLCVRFFRRADGTVLTADCPVGVAARLRERVLSFWNKIAAACVALLPAFATGCQWSPRPVEDGVGCGVVMGKIAMPVGPAPAPEPPPRELGPDLHELQPEVEVDGPCFPPRPIGRGRG